MATSAPSLIVVESPAKAKTLGQFLGSQYEVLACMGHVRALPSKSGSVDISRDFEPKYAVLPQSKKHLDKIEKALRRCSTVYLATDMDREGEAISWHLTVSLGLGNATPPARKGRPVEVKRIVFHEITREAIEEALKHPRTIASQLVDAQQARVVLDYLYGFNLSPLLWKKIRPGLSAGRVQSVALRLICEREKEIRDFVPQEYWTIRADLSSRGDDSAGHAFSAELVEMDGGKLDKFQIGHQATADAVVARLEGAAYAVREIRRKQVKRNPAPPFTTSTLQQEASRKLRFSAKKTMSIAQKLYEGIALDEGMKGLITYMRTDSVHLADSALYSIKEKIIALYGKPYALKHPRAFKQKSKNAQEAHEAIRPTDIALTPEELHAHLTPDQFKLYELIWKRTIACQMAQAVLDAVAVDIAAGEGFLFRATGSTVAFPGFMKVYTEGRDDNGNDKEMMLPRLSEGQDLDLKTLVPEQHFTQPPPRYTEATLVKTLEEYGIGRPSTYASIIEILKTRRYVTVTDRRFFPEDLGVTVNGLLVDHFPRYVDYHFTAHLEEELDEIARGEMEWKPVVRNFWKPFINLIGEKEAEIKRHEIITEKTDEACPQCGKNLIIRLGRYGKFLGCSGYPECRYIRSLAPRENGASGPDAASGEPCEKCGRPMVVKEGRYGKFLACSGYPECKSIKSLNKSVPTGIKCPECAEGDVIGKKTRRNRMFYGCSRYPQCSFATWNKPVNEPCPQCGSPFLVEKESKRYGVIVSCAKKECGYKKKRSDE